jgi:hypothetical protein
MYIIVLTDGKAINIKATEVEWCEKSRMIKLFNDGRIVARVNMDNVVGWIDADYKAESEDISKYKNIYNKGWDDGAKATYEHLKMCEEEQEPSCPFYKIDEDGHGICKNGRYMESEGKA